MSKSKDVFHPLQPTNQWGVGQCSETFFNLVPLISCMLSPEWFYTCLANDVIGRGQDFIEAWSSGGPTTPTQRSVLFRKPTKQTDASTIQFGRMWANICTAYLYEWCLWATQLDLEWCIPKLLSTLTNHHPGDFICMPLFVCLFEKVYKSLSIVQSGRGYHTNCPRV